MSNKFLFELDLKEIKIIRVSYIGVRTCWIERWVSLEYEKKMKCVLKRWQLTYIVYFVVEK